MALFRFSLIYLKVHVADSGITVVKDQAKPGNVASRDSTPFGGDRDGRSVPVTE